MHYAHFSFATDAFRDGAATLAQNVNAIHGHALASLIASALRAHGYEVSDPFDEDHGWDFTIVHNGSRYVCACSLAMEGGGTAEAHVVLGKSRSLLERIRGRGRMAADDAVAAAIAAALEAHPDVRGLQRD